MIIIVGGNLKLFLKQKDKLEIPVCEFIRFPPIIWFSYVKNEDAEDFAVHKLFRFLKGEGVCSPIDDVIR